MSDSDKLRSYFGFEILDIIRAISFENQTVESKQVFGSTGLLHSRSTTTRFVLVYNCPAALVKWSSQLPTPDSLARCTTQYSHLPNKRAVLILAG